MPKVLTKVEKLDSRYPGLADSIRNWFLQGVTASEVSKLVGERYNLNLSRSSIARFRVIVWVPKQKLFTEKRIESRVAQELATEREMKAEMAQTLSGDVK